ncbi:MAG: FHA domain-containing protein [Chloroflexota bacterium]|nr:MAG: FHA domain-containing protein [Chloroflexota bacterium]
MIVCPNCQHKEVQGALFCSDCGAQLFMTEGVPTQSIHGATNSLRNAQYYGDLHIPTPPAMDATVSLHILDAGQILPLVGRNEFTLGRVSEGQPVLPDIDLSPFRAFEKGTSRLHACIKIMDQQTTITDLGSVNGTRLNGIKLPANQTHTLSHGDIVSLGKLKIQVLIRK